MIKRLLLVILITITTPVIPYAVGVFIGEKVYVHLPANPFILWIMGFAILTLLIITISLVYTLINITIDYIKYG